MIAKGLLLLAVVAYSQAYYIGGLIPLPKPIIHHKVIPIVKTIREPVYIEKRVRVPHYIERAIPVPFAVGGGAGAGGVGAVAGAGSIDFGLKAQIEDADTVNINAGVSGVAGVAGVGGGSIGGISDNNGFNDNEFNNNDFGGFRGIRGQGPQSIRVQQTQLSAPSARISQPIIGGRGHGIQKKPIQPHFGGHF